jgi:hypothetical protein
LVLNNDEQRLAVAKMVEYHIHYVEETVQVLLPNLEAVNDENIHV